MKRRRYPAALLACALLLGLCACGEPTPTDTQAPTDYTVREAVYPQMAPFPQDSSNFRPAREAWEKDFWRLRDQPEGYADSARPFLNASIRTFLSDSQGENQVCSPLNLYMALAMLAELTGGASRQQVLDCLGAADLTALRQQATALWNANYCDDGFLTSILASSLWLNQNVDFTQETMENLAEFYHASSFQGPMGSASFNKALQDWVNQQTGGLLEEQAASLEMSPETVLSLASTVYLKSRWSYQFSPSATTPDVFHTGQGTVNCDFMHQTDYMNYYQGEGFSAVYLPMVNLGQMLLILPEPDVSPDELLQGSALYEVLSSDEEWNPVSVSLSLPKFDVASNLDLKDGLRALGITDALDADLADFSPTTAAPLVLSLAEHAARVTIDEEGCTAAAYTVMMGAGGTAMPEEALDFILDRPFLFILTNLDGLPLFAGVVNRPV